ncbi:MAG: hypothetical protein WD651_13485 [Acidimicrobiia bacterium]
MTEIASFTGPLSILANTARIPIEFDGDRYTTLEHAYGSWRVKGADDAEAIRLAPTGRAVAYRHLTRGRGARRALRKVTGFSTDPLFKRVGV